MFSVNYFFIPNRINRAIYVNDIIIIKTAYNVYNGIHTSDVTQKLVTQSFAFAGSFYQPGNVHKLNGGRYNTLWLNQFFKFIQPGVGYRYHPYIRVNGTKRKISCLSFGR